MSQELKKDSQIPEGISVNTPETLPELGSKREQLCERLNGLHSAFNLKFKPSDMFLGAVFVSQKKLRNNPDWMSQTANSLREILYPFYSRDADGIPTDKKEVLAQYGSAHASNEQSINEMGRVYGHLNALTHHNNGKNKYDVDSFSESDFENLIGSFENVIFDVLSRQNDIHKDLDEIATAGPEIIIDDNDKK